MLIATKGIWASPNFYFFGKILNGSRAHRVKEKNVVVLVELKMIRLFAYHFPAKFKYIDQKIWFQVPSLSSWMLPEFMINYWNCHLIALNADAWCLSLLHWFASIIVRQLTSSYKVLTSDIIIQYYCSNLHFIFNLFSFFFFPFFKGKKDPNKVQKFKFHWKLHYEKSWNQDHLYFKAMLFSCISTLFLIIFEFWKKQFLKI